MPKIVVYKPQDSGSDVENEIDIGDEPTPAIVVESCEDVITCNKLTFYDYKTKPLTSSPPGLSGVRRSASQTRKPDNKRMKSNNRPVLEMDVCRISMPCNTGCCYCTFTNKLGPVKVFMSSFQPEKGKFLSDIRDGRGKRVIPLSRKGDLKGLIFDKETFAFHPPPSLCHNNNIDPKRGRKR